MRYRLRTLMIAIAVVALAITAVLWWRKPYVLRATYPNGTIAWEQWERRSFAGRPEYLHITWYYTNGQKSSENKSGSFKRWSPDGRPITSDEWAEFVLEDCGGIFPDRDSISRRRWPLNP